MRLVSRVRIGPSGTARRLVARSATRGLLNVTEGQEATFFQSEQERDLLVLCRNSSEVRSVTWEPFRLHYFDHTRKREASYTPDYLIEYETGGHIKRLLVEVKTVREYHRRRGEFAARYRAAERWAEMQPVTAFKVATDVWMQEVGLESYKRLDQVRRREVPDIHLDTIRSQFFAAEVLSLRAIIGTAATRGLHQAFVMPAVLKLVSLGLLAFDVRRPLTLESKFHEGFLPPLFQ